MRDNNGALIMIIFTALCLTLGFIFLVNSTYLNYNQDLFGISLILILNGLFGFVSYIILIKEQKEQIINQKGGVNGI